MTYYKPPKSPCHYCERRSAECHATCEEYQEFWIKQQEYRDMKIKLHEESIKKYPNHRRQK